MELYTHILQKTGVLKTFTVAKVVRKKEIEDLKKLIKEIASDEAEYNKMLEEEISKISNMHDKNNPIPGIIYNNENPQSRQEVLLLCKKISKMVKDKNLSKNEMAFLISAIITELDLGPEDFFKLKKDLQNEIGDDDEDYTDEETDEDGDEEDDF